MADYYPLLSRAVGALSDSNADARRSIYERARKALIGQLQAIQPPIAEADIARETDALDAAIARVEAEIAGKTAAEVAKAPEAPAKPVAPPPPPPAAPKTEPPRTEGPETPKAEAAKPEIPKPAPGKPTLPPVPPRAAAPSAPAPQPPVARPTVPPPPAPQSPLPKSPLPKPPLPTPPGPAGEKPAAPAAPIPAVPPKPFAFRPPAAVEAEKAARKAEIEKAESEKGEQEKAKIDKGDEADSGETADNELESPPSLKPPRPREAPRPAAPSPATQNGRGNRLWIVGGVVVGVVLLIAGLAIKLRGRPEDLAKLRPAPAAPAEQQSSGKIAGRVGGENPSTTPEKTENKTAPAPAQNQPPLPVAHRAALLLEAPETPEKVKTYIGSVVWRLDNVPTGPGQPLGTAIHAEVEIPDAKVRMTIDIQKNTDASLNASHTIEVRFALQPGSVLPGVKQIGAVQMRREDMANGDGLAGVPVPITETYYLVGLARGDMEARNMELLKNRGWLDVPLALTNGRIAKFSLEKGASGDRVINDALSVWAQQK
ncbi:MAG: hypothetical protein U1E30_12935 [Rhodoblastus sp.]